MCAILLSGSKKDGLRVWSGDMVGVKAKKGLEQSRVLVLAMSANAFASEWVMLERHTPIKGKSMPIR